MLIETTINKLHELRLSRMAETFRNQIMDTNFSALSFEERLGLMVDSEWLRRKNNRLSRLVSQATLHFSSACLENIEYHEDRKLNRAQIIRLSACNYISENNNIIIMGATGTGKTYLSCALGISACRNYYSVKYTRLSDLLSDIAVARDEGSCRKTINFYKRIKLLILDEWLLTPINQTEAKDLLEIIDARHLQHSTIFCSQSSPAGWHGQLGEGTLADAILDRIVHNSYSIKIEGMDSMRKRKGLNTELQ